MKNKQLLFFGMIFLILLIGTPLIHASDIQQVSSLGTFKQYECVNLIQTCSNCTYVNITSVLYPNSTMALGEVEMEAAGTFYNYSFCSTQALGSYIVTGRGDLNGAEEVFGYTFIVNPVGGMENNTLIFLVLIILAVVLLLIAFLSKNTILAFLSGISFLGAGVYSTIYGFGNITSTYTYIASAIIVGIGMILTITSALDFIDEMYGNDEYAEVVEE